MEHMNQIRKDIQPTSKATAEDMTNKKEETDIQLDPPK